MKRTLKRNYRAFSVFPEALKQYFRWNWKWHISQFWLFYFCSSAKNSVYSNHYSFFKNILYHRDSFDYRKNINIEESCVYEYYGVSVEEDDNVDELVDRSELESQVVQSVECSSQSESESEDEVSWDTGLSSKKCKKC